MNHLYFNPFSCFFYGAVALLLGSCSTPTTTTTTTTTHTAEQTENQPKTVLGQWTYKLLICKKEDGEKKESNFSVTIGQDYLSLSGNALECNQCTQECTVEEKRIIFSNKSTYKTCTKMACDHLYRVCDNPNILTNLFQDMEYDLKDDILILKQGNQSLKLQRQL